MRRRLLAITVPVVLLLGSVIAIVLAGTIADDHTAELNTDRSNDAARFTVAALTSLGEDSPAETERLVAEMDAYADLYDTPLWLVDRETAVIHASAGTELPHEVLSDLGIVLAGQPAVLAERIWPWSPDRVSIVVPVGRDSQVVAALVMDVPTDGAKADVLREWGLLSIVVVLPLLVLVSALWPLSRWLIRPVEDLSRSVSAVAGGDLAARADVESGPPELQGLSRTFNRMVESVGTTVERQHQFLDDAAHQLRNPVTSTRLAVENLEPHLDDDPAARETWAEAVDDVERMATVIEGLLEATRLQTRPARESALTTALGAAPERTRRRCEDAGVAVTWDVDADVTVVEPTGGLASVVDELVSNALRLSGCRRLDVVGRRDGGRYRLEVADDGRGLDPGERELAMQRFWRSPHTQNVDGTGLGLTIVAQVVADTGGSVTLHDSDTGGLCARVELPVVAQVTA